MLLLILTMLIVFWVLFVWVSERVSSAGRQGRLYLGSTNEDVWLHIAL